MNLQHRRQGRSTLPVVAATEGNDGFDDLEAAEGDRPRHPRPGFVNTASCHVGDHLHRRRRGHPALPRLPDRAAGRAVHASSRSSYLLIYGELPTPAAAGRLRRPGSAGTRCCTRTSSAFFDGLPARRAPDAGAVVGGRRRCRPSTRTASTRRRRSRSRSRPSACWPSCRRSRPTPTRSASASRSSTPTTRLGLVENFLRMMFGFPAEPYDVDPVMVKALDLLFILHADHEQNCSTSTVRLVGSAQANLFASVSAGINALCGPLHGGANQAVLEMLEQIQDDGGDVDDVRAAGQEQGGRRPADGLRPPRLQELRPARRDRQEDRRRDARASSASTTSCSTSRCSSRRSRSPTTTSSSASSTRTSTSTPA